MGDPALLAPGPGLAAMLAEEDPARLDPAGLVDALVGFERLASWVAAGQARLLAALGKTLVHGDEDWTREEVAAALRLSGQTAQRRIDVARELCARLSGTLRALSVGELSYLQAMVIAEATRELDDRSAAEVEDRVLGRATGQTVAELRRSVARAVLAADPARAEQAHERAVCERTVQCWPVPAGMAEIRALLDAPDAALVMYTVNALAAKTDTTDDRPIEARRADAFVAVFTGALSVPGLPQAQRSPAQIQVTVPATTLLGLTDIPGELAGYGPITAEVARRIAAHGTWRRLLTDPASGQLLDYGRQTYRPPAQLAAFVIARDRTCGFPGCNQPARRCDLDHCKSWRAGGTTCPHNLGALCRRHHRAKDTGPWTLIRHPDGSTTWISPTGKHYHRPPPSYDDP
ncbi:MAG TPA: DUF222 domain-containing protein [Actinomycetes bacterium]|nr:DUF222 domain-containing protein [Actinomycetes bacterium]